MFTTQFWLVVIGLAQAIGFGWISSKVQKCSYKRDIRSRHSYVLLAILLAEEETAEYNIISYTKAYLVPKQQELQALWIRKI